MCSSHDRPVSEIVREEDLEALLYPRREIEAPRTLEKIAATFTKLLSLRADQSNKTVDQNSIVFLHRWSAIKTLRSIEARVAARILDGFLGRPIVRLPTPQGRAKMLAILIYPNLGLFFVSQHCNLICKSNAPAACSCDGLFSDWYRSCCSGQLI